MAFVGGTFALVVVGDNCCKGRAAVVEGTSWVALVEGTLWAVRVEGILAVGDIDA